VQGISQNFHTLLAALDTEIFPDPGGVLLKNVVVLAKRVALPLVGEQNALQVGMATKGDAKEVEDFALEPIGGGPDGDEAAGLFIGAEWNFQTQPRVVSEGIELRNEIAPLLAARPVDGGVVFKQIEFFFVAGVAGDFEELRGIHNEDGLLAVFERIKDPGAKVFAIAA
jgi:hypothetical protein